MRTYTIQPRDPTGSWDNVPTLRIDQPFGKIPEGLKAFGQFQYDDMKLYVHLWAEEKDVRAEESGPLAAPCKDSCLEFFFCPKQGDNRYFNIEFNPKGASYVGIGSSLKDLLRLLPEEGVPPFDPVAQQTKTGWEIFYQVPWAFVRRIFPDFEVAKGMEIRANCFKCGDLTPMPHYLSWNIHTAEAPAFHFPQYFGKMIFG